MPQQMSREELLAVLDDIRKGVESGDTLEGSFEFLLDYDSDAPAWQVRAFYRTGNTMGQGGSRLIGYEPAPAEPEPEDDEPVDADGG
jgi:hypothetical protein